MIIIVAHSSREAAALLSLAESKGWSACSCTSVRQFRKQLRNMHPAVVLTRDRLVDGYSDDIFTLLSQSEPRSGPRVIVLAPADFTQKQEARQLSIGADCVIRDPLRPDVLMEYLAKFLHHASTRNPRPMPSEQFNLAGALVSPDQLEMSFGGKSVHVSPREIELARLLAESPGKTITYAFLYSELFNRAFSGDSANLRVLLGKLAASFRKLGLNLRAMIRVTQKTGYCYVPPSAGRASQSRSA